MGASSSHTLCMGSYSIPTSLRCHWLQFRCVSTIHSRGAPSLSVRHADRRRRVSVDDCRFKPNIAYSHPYSEHMAATVLDSNPIRSKLPPQTATLSLSPVRVFFLGGRGLSVPCRAAPRILRGIAACWHCDHRDTKLCIDERFNSPKH